MHKIDKSNLPLFIFLIISVLIIPFLYTTSSLDPAYITRFLAFSVLTFLFFIFFIIRTLRDPGYFDLALLRNYIFPVWAVYILFVGLSIIQAENTTEAIADFLKHFTVFIYFILSSLLLSRVRNSYDILSKTVTIFSLLIILIGIYQIYDLLIKGEFDHQASYYVRGLSAHRNLFAQILLLSFPFSVFCILNFKGYWKTLSLVSAISTMLFITFLLTKSVWVAMIVSIFLSFVLAVIVFYKSFQEKKSFMRKIFVVTFILFSILVFSGILFSKLANPEVLKKQTYWLKNNQFGSSKERVELWKKSVSMIKESPITGVGSGNWKIMISKYGTKDLRSEKGKVFFQRPHNDFIWVLCETGIGGLVFFILIFIINIYYVFKILRNEENIKVKSFIILMFFFIISYVIISMLSFPRERIEHTIFLVLCFSSIVVTYHQQKNNNLSIRINYILWLSMPVLLILLAGIIIGFIRMSGEIHINKALKYKTKNEWTQVIHEVDKAYNKFCTLDYTSTPIFWHRGVSNYNLGLIDEALSDFRESYVANPYHLHVLNNLGTCYGLMGEHNTSISYYNKALKVSPQFENALLNLCVSYLNKDNTDSAYFFLSRCNPYTENPNYPGFVTTLLSNIIKNLISETDDRLIKINLNRIRNSDEWMKKVFMQALENKTSYNYQLLTETIYLLESVDSVITPEQSKTYKQKFKIIN